MRVLFLNQGSLRSGVLGHARVEQATAAGLHGVPGVDARFVRMGPWGPLARALGGRWPGLHEAGIDLHVARWYLVDGGRGALAWRRHLEAFRPDVVHVHTHSLAFTAARLMRRVPTALVVDCTVAEWQGMGAATGTGPRSELELRAGLALERRALRAAALVLAWNAHAARDVRAACPEARVAIHHPGVETDVFAPAPRTPRERPRVLFVGGRFEEKGGPELLDALGPRLGRDVELDLVTPVVRVERPGVRVHRLEAREPALLELLRQADVLCLPTHRDSFPYVLLEAMASGTPVVASTISGIPEMLAGSRAGRLVPPGDVRALRAALDALLDDRAARRAAGEEARRLMLARYDARAQTARLLVLLGELRAGA